MTTTDMETRNWHDFVRPGSSITVYLMTMLTATILFAGWWVRDEEHLTPDSGLGYWLGIAGSLMMVMLLYYSYRKRQKPGSGIGSIPTWFRIHMFLGVAGPLLVVLHSNFRLGALNSNVALFTMLTVAFSGLIGRYIYGKIHLGLHGRSVVAQEVMAIVESLRKEFGERTNLAEPMFAEIDAFGRKIMERSDSNAVESLFFGGLQVVRATLMRMRLRRNIRRLVDMEGRAKGWSWRERRRRVAETTDAVTAYFDAVLKVAELRFFERLFSLWHLLHLPLFFLMVITALIHIWAVHRY
jgi:hypothetical protein